MINKTVEGFEDLKMIKAFEKELLKNNELVYLIWKVSLNLALRISDTLAITEKDAQRFIRTGYYLGKDRKTNKSNRVKLNENTKAALIRALELKSTMMNENNPYLFVSRSNRSRNSVKHISRIQVFRVYKEVVDYLNLDIHIATHSARKTWGVQVYQKTKNIALVMERLNHSSERSTLKYLGITQEKMNKIIEEFNL
ncbi:site-specific integrase [Propionigenium maris DSM 9537]|uniref:Site-specific integrase n=1 Tax=Propionigenium maris DSM 9537 TaxID=1123000 RepID=A0A9W6GMZ7_9FUSO|nr:tyrosine-type recombinase/integrase [Propionigenium maris]GLI57307.1 site-specific integrase [Propionigenium maris DSM 9537]